MDGRICLFLAEGDGIDICPSVIHVKEMRFWDMTKFTYDPTLSVTLSNS